MENHVQSGASETFNPPRHWLGIEELNAEYWSDPKVRERRGQEFHDKPIETLALIEKLDQKGIARRDFLTIMGASMAMASFACARRPVHKIIPYVVKPEEITVGVANYYASTSGDTGYGVLIRTREGRPIKLEGNPQHPLNQGALGPRDQAAILDLYDPDRLKEPVSRTRASGARKTVSWQEADAAVIGKLRTAGAGKVRVLSQRVMGESTRRLVGEFTSAFGGGSWVEFDPLFPEEINEAQAESYGTALTPTYHFDRAEMILSIGADPLGVWLSPVEHMAAWVRNRKLSQAQVEQTTLTGAKTLSKMVVFEPIMSLTGANADERYPIRPGDELKVAMAIAHELIVAQKKSRFAGDAAVTGALASYKPEAVATEIGLEKGAEKIRKLAAELWDARGKSLVVGGGLQSKNQDALSLQLAVNLLNSALENDGVTVDGTGNPDTRPAGGFSALSKLIHDMKSGQVDFLVLYRTNPAFALPKTAGFEEALAKVPTVVMVSDREDETGLLSDMILPDHHFLENWGDAHPRRGIYSVGQPAISPIHSTRAFQDTLLAWMKGVGKTPGLSARSKDWHEYLMNNWRETIYTQGGSGGFEAFWENTLSNGVFLTSAAKSERSSARSFRSASASRIPAYKASSGNEIRLALYAKNTILDGSQAQPNNPWLQEMPDSITTVTWDNFLSVGPSLAEKLNLKQDDVVEVTGADGIKLELPVAVQPGLHPQAVGILVGYGRRAVGKVGDGTGVDVYPLIQVAGDRLVYSGQPVSLRKTGKFYRLAATQWHGASEDRPIINDISLAAFKANPSAANHTDPHLRLETVPTIWPEHNYPGYRWGMAIDLNSCTGCGACSIGCQAENNIPVVGRDNVRVSRQMHWIRIDRYYSGSPENPEVVFQPMLCQHCENAPCETVCPVLATVHNNEGINEQVYNRCVGTRYCQNNCPYKVRRFNFFDHWKNYEGTMNMAWNPDVTVRTRGIMEKCTFCVQRIRDAKDRASLAGVKVKDGDFKTACQQTCPTDAIVFGDINDPNSRVSKLRGDQRAFRVLEILNTKPSISYLTKVRNKEEGAEHGHH